MSWKRNLRLLGRIAIPLAIGFLASSPMLAQGHTTGLTVTKTCPGTAAPGSTFNCTFSVQNADVQHGVINMTFTNTVPFPGGTPTSTTCLQGGVAVTSLGVNGSGTDTCGGTVTETAPGCTATNVFLVDQVNATGSDAGVPGLPVQGSASGAVLIAACTPTPTATFTPTFTPTATPTTIFTGTPTNTPTETPTNTPTFTPPASAPPPVPTLSFPMMVLLGLLLAGAGLFFARRP